MITRHLLDEDRALKRLATIPKNQRTVYDWRGLANGCDELLEVGFHVEEVPESSDLADDTKASLVAALDTFAKQFA